MYSRICNLEYIMQDIYFGTYDIENIIQNMQHRTLSKMRDVEYIIQYTNAYMLQRYNNIYNTDSIICNIEYFKKNT